MEVSIKGMLLKKLGGCGLDSSISGQVQVSGLCENGEEFSANVKQGYSWLSEQPWAVQERIPATKLIN